MKTAPEVVKTLIEICKTALPFSILLFSLAAYAAAPALKVTNLRCEYKTNPLGIDAAQPRLLWQIVSPQRGVRQSAYEIRAAGSEASLKAGRELIWSSGAVASDLSVHVPYAGPALKSGQRLWWQVRVWDQEGSASDWSEPAWWEMGLLDASDWKASWIAPDLSEDPEKSNPAPMLRREFNIEGPVTSARAYVTALGLYEMEINGRRVGDQVFTPGWTAYDDRLQYQTYDVTGLLRAGDNAVGVVLGDGWFRGHMGWGDNRNIYGEKLALLMQLHIVLEDGREMDLVTDGEWSSATGPILMSDIYNGESYDARLERAGWSRPGYQCEGLSGVRVIDHSKEILLAPAGPPILRIEEIKPVEILNTPDGDLVFDMGQNMVGWIRFNVRGPAGRTVVLRHAEVLDREGNFYTDNLRAADQTVRYTLRGGGEEVYEPHFTFQGFRYVKVEGWPGQPGRDNLTGVVIHSDVTPAGTFECSNRLINQLQHNIQWGQKGNFLDVPTDCPQRDERLGWTGDAQAFARTACFNADCAGFYTKWLKDLAADQKADGAVPHVIPNVLSHNTPGAAGSSGWADAAVIVPWTVYLCYGDTRILEQQYDSMADWVGCIAGRAGESHLWNSGHHFGDWLAFNTTRSDYPGATTDKDLIATAFFGYSTSLLAESARILGKNGDAVKYSELFEKIKTAFKHEFVTPGGRLASNTQTAYTLALAFNLLPADQRESAALRLAEDVRKFGHITTGFLGTPLISHVLSEFGYFDEAYQLLMRTDYPSWLYPVTMGATTIWERWDGIKPDSTFQDPGMNSFNHYAYGAIGDWLYRRVSGLDIAPDGAGYKRILIHPHPGGELEYARASHASLYGRVASGWMLQNGRMKLEVEIPSNTSAIIHLPGAQIETVTESGQSLEKAGGIIGSVQEQGSVRVEAGSGKYRFEYPVPD